MTTPPRIDQRGAVEIARQLETLIGEYVPEWRERGPATGFSAALIGVFARFAELTIQRLNEVPAKNQLAFLDLLGASPMPPQPARAPLTFTLAAGALGALVPARTPVAATVNGRPLIFETETELAVTPARLARVVSWDGKGDRIADHSRVTDAGSGDPAIVFQGDGPTPHTFSIAAEEFFSGMTIRELSLRVFLDDFLEPPNDPRSVQWEIVDGANGKPLKLSTGDGTANLTRMGTLGFNPLEQIPTTVIGGQTGRWLRARLLTPITRSQDPVTGRVRVGQLPRIQSMDLSALVESAPVPPDHAFGGAQTLDVSRDFFPFGERPTVGATWYIASDAAFASRGRTLRIKVQLSPAGPGLAYGTASSDLVIRWEFWDGTIWAPLGDAKPIPEIVFGQPRFTDTTRAFTTSGEISFSPDIPFARTRVNGVEGYWARARIVSGWFDIRSAANLVGPSVAQVTVQYDSSFRGFFPRSPETIVVDDGMTTTALTGVVFSARFVAFPPAPDAERSLYLGFTLPPGQAALAQAPVSLFAEFAPIPFGTPPDAADPGPAPELAWSYLGARGWSGLGVEDGTEALTLSGPLRFLPPRDLVATALFGGPPLLWIRATWIRGEYRFLPRLHRLLLNTVPAEQAVTVLNEVIGSGTGEAALRLRAAQRPILAGPCLEVVEPELPSAEERQRIVAAEGPAAITASVDGGVRVRWQEVGDFHSSGPRDRHYLVDHESGEIRFGDGRSGMIPPRGAGNLRLARYRTGGGAPGNVAAATIVQLKTTVPYIDRVTNPVAAVGGVDAEALDAVRQRAPRMVRHGGRAVTAQDFEDLATSATAEVARALAVPLLDLAVDPDGLHPQPGTVTVVVVPNEATPRPTPSIALVDRVLDRLRAGAAAGTDIVVVGPEYLRVDVLAEIALVALEGAGAVAAAVQATLDRFLHPLTGGRDGDGWAFGRQPHASELQALLQAVPGVDHLRRLDVAIVPDRAGAAATGRCLLCSGQHMIDLVLRS